MNTFNDFFNYGKITKLSRKVFSNDDLFPLSEEEGRLIGIEVEVEKMSKGMPLLSYWEMIHDGSLRDNGFEFRTPAFPLKYATVVVNDLYLALQKYEPQHNFSERTSIHVHFDFRHEECQTLIKLILLYSIFEKALFLFASPERYYSSFCVPFYESVHTRHFSNAILAVKQGKELSEYTLCDIINEVCGGKYSALNLQNLFNHKENDKHRGCGSIEFRQLGGTDDKNKLLLWIKLLSLLITYAKKTTLVDIETYTKNLNTTSEYDVLLRDVFKEYWSVLIPRPYNMSVFSQGVSFAKEMLFHRSSPRLDEVSPLGIALKKRIRKVKMEQW